MKSRVLTFIIAALFVCLGAVSFAEDAAQSSSKILLNPGCTSWAVREYKVDVGVRGKMPAPDGKDQISMDSDVSLTVKHKYSRREDDGLMPLEISVTKGEAIIRDKENAVEQKLTVAPASYPKLTVLLDRNCRPTDIFGMAGSRYAEGLPGLNYANMIILFLPDMVGQPRAVGEKWETKLTIPNYGETYNFINTLKSVDPLSRNAAVSQEITWEPRNGSTVKAVVESTFSMEDGKLLKSRAQCQVMRQSTDEKDTSASRQEAGANQANISVDITLIK